MPPGSDHNRPAPRLRSAPDRAQALYALHSLTHSAAPKRTCRKL